VRQRVAWIVVRRGKFGLVGQDRRGRREHEVVGLAWRERSCRAARRSCCTPPSRPAAEVFARQLTIRR
jgi:hypothetical protein